MYLMELYCTAECGHVNVSPLNGELLCHRRARKTNVYLFEYVHLRLLLHILNPSSLFLSGGLHELLATLPSQLQSHVGRAEDNVFLQDMFGVRSFHALIKVNQQCVKVGKV